MNCFVKYLFCCWCIDTSSEYEDIPNRIYYTTAEGNRYIRNNDL